MEENTPKAVLLLADGTVFHGKAAGAIGTTVGEIAFNTGMTGYQEIFTDPSYYGQIVVMNASHIGNYGVTENDVESDGLKISGMVCKKFAKVYSRAAATKGLQEYFEENKLVSISDIDTRKLVRHIRNAGAMNAIISSDNLDIDDLKKQLELVPSMEGLELSSKVSTKEPYFVGDENANIRIAVLDLGTKKNILRSLAERGAYLKVFPMSANKEEFMAFEPDGFMFSNGPGDPAAMTDQIKLVSELIDSGIPCFGICLGHQVIALSQGLSTKKMHHGHRGINHPVKNLDTGKAEVTSQNHGFVVDEEMLGKNPNIKVTHRHLNDNTIAGIKLLDKPVFSVQFHPEACPGPHDSRYLFDQFIQVITSNLELKKKKEVNILS
ncbi:MAG: glutamine-hydrolyzing carbamoyl-phosphate synthase small subunit [Flavobacteriales bacterium]|nr:glutamine-hydrolyzing carbamoyl-phosphate synthase small subunit [Flavobacteriales bacterium]